MSLDQIKDEKILSPLLCRICATEQEECMNNVFTSIHNGIYFIDMLQYCLQRSILDKDNRLPLSICLECTSNLIIAYNLIILCNDSDQKFRQILGYPLECNSLEQKVEVVIDESEHDIKPSYFVDCAVIETSKRNCDTMDLKSRHDKLIDTMNVAASTESQTQRKINKTRASRYECYRCKSTFRRIYCLRQHLRQHVTYHYNDRQLWKCSECQKCFEKRKSLVKHLYKHTNATCEYCTETFSTLRDLKQHCLRTHNEELINYKCDLCPRKFILKGQLVIHMHNHDTSQRYNCNVCNETFGTDMQLKGHVRAVHTSFLCAECGKTFKNNSLLTSHQKVHNSDRPFVCLKCPSRFKWKVALTYHMTIHQTERKHVCETCGMSFTTRSAMKGHMRIHTGERPFACNKCSKSFYRSTHLTRHYLSHTGETPYKCKFCEKGFRQCAQLNKHLRTHVGENTYQCDVCPKNYRLKVDLKKHFHEHYENKNTVATVVGATSE